MKLNWLLDNHQTLTTLHCDPLSNSNNRLSSTKVMRTVTRMHSYMSTVTIWIGKWCPINGCALLLTLSGILFGIWFYFSCQMWILQIAMKSTQQHFAYTMSVVMVARVCGNLGFYSLSDCKVSRFRVEVVRFLWPWTGDSAEVLPSCMSNCKEVYGDFNTRSPRFEILR